MELKDYKKEKLENHIYKNTDTYVGGADLIDEFLPIWNPNNNKIEFQEFRTIKKAFFKAIKDIKNSKLISTKTILFSPSSASFDEFKNFEDRGAHFNFLVESFKNNI